MGGGAWWAAVHGVAKSRTRLSDFPFTFHFHALEKEMATHSSVLAWRIPGTGEPGGLPSMGSHRVGHGWSDLAVAAVASFKQHREQQNMLNYTMRMQSAKSRHWLSGWPTVWIYRANHLFYNNFIGRGKRIQGGGSYHLKDLRSIQPVVLCVPYMDPKLKQKVSFISVCVKSLQLCPTLWDLMGCSPPGSSVHGILQARILEWVAMSSSRGSSQPRDWTLVSYTSCIGRWIL